MKLSPRVPSGPLNEKWDRHRFDLKLVNPANKRVRRHRRRLRPGRRLRRRDARRAGLQRALLLLPGQPASGALDRRPGRHQRRQELPERRRQHLAAVLRHRQGRRLPFPRGQRLPAGPGRRTRSSTSAWPRGCRSPASTAAASTTARSAARRCRARSTLAVRPASNCCWAPTRRSAARSIWARCEMYSATEMLDVVVERRAGPRHRHPRLENGSDRDALRRRRGAGHRRLRQRVLSYRPTPRAATRRRSGGRIAVGLCSPTPVTRRSIRPVSRRAATFSRS